MTAPPSDAPGGEGFEDVAARLRDVRWGSAPDWDDSAKTLLWAHYEKIAALGAHDAWYGPPTVGTGRGQIREEDAPRIAAAEASIRAAADARRTAIEATTRALVPHILVWALAVEVGTIAAEEDPGAPLVTLFEAGFQLGWRHEGVHIYHQRGWRIYQRPRG